MEFRFGLKKRPSAADAAIGTLRFRVRVLASERRLGSLLPCDVILLVGKFGTPLRVGFADFFVAHGNSLQHIGGLRCTRADGTVRWQKQPKHGAFFALHDLTHFAVETALGYRARLLRLDRGKLGPKGCRSKCRARTSPGRGDRGGTDRGLFKSERLLVFCRARKNSIHLRRAGLTAEQIGCVRAIRADLFQRCAAVPKGAGLELQFQQTPARKAPTSKGRLLQP